MQRFILMLALCVCHKVSSRAHHAVPLEDPIIWYGQLIVECIQFFQVRQDVACGGGPADAALCLEWLILVVCCAAAVLIRWTVFSDSPCVALPSVLHHTASPVLWRTHQPQPGWREMLSIKCLLYTITTCMPGLYPCWKLYQWNLEHSLKSF